MLEAVEPNTAGRPVDNPTFRYFLEEAALWRRAKVSASDVVNAAVQALLEGIESPSFILIAGLTKAEAEAELGELLPPALDELRLDCLGYDDPNNDILAAAALTRSFLYGHLEAQQLTQAIHQTFGHMCHPLVEELSCLDDSFDTLDYVPNPTREQLVRKTHIAAANLRNKADQIYSEAQS
jgi:hypothetical protein